MIKISQIRMIALVHQKLNNQNLDFHNLLQNQKIMDKKKNLCLLLYYQELLQRMMNRTHQENQKMDSKDQRNHLLKFQNHSQMKNLLKLILLVLFQEMIFNLPCQSLRQFLLHLLSSTQLLNSLEINIRNHS